MDLVGVPTSVKELPKRYDGDHQSRELMSPNMEVVKSLDPTDVLSVTTLEYDLAPVFKNAAVNATFLNLTSLDNMNKEIIALGDKYSRQKQAQAIVAKYTDKQKEINQKIAGKKQPSVLILLGVPGSYLVATENSYIGDLVKRAGGINVVQGEKVEYLASNTEYLQQANPTLFYERPMGCRMKSFKCSIRNSRKMIYGSILKLFSITGFMICRRICSEQRAILPLRKPLMSL